MANTQDNGKGPKQSAGTNASEPRPSEAVVNDLNSGPTAEQAVAEAQTEGHVTGEQPRVTRAEGEVPGTVGHTAPGDAPADTWDPSERVSTATPSGRELAEAAKEGHGSVVAYVKIGEVGGRTEETEGDARTETYDVTVNPLTGATVKVERDLDTGVSRRV